MRTIIDVEMFIDHVSVLRRLHENAMHSAKDDNQRRFYQGIFKGLDLAVDAIKEHARIETETEKVIQEGVNHHVDSVLHI